MEIKGEKNIDKKGMKGEKNLDKIGNER